MLGFLAALLCMVGLNLSGTGIVAAYSMATYLLIWYYAIVFGIGLSISALILLLVMLSGAAFGTLTQHPIVGLVMGTVVSGTGFLAMLAGAMRGALFIAGAWFMHSAVMPAAVSLADLDMKNLGIGLGLIVIGLILNRRGKSRSDD